MCDNIEEGKVVNVNTLDEADVEAKAESTAALATKCVVKKMETNESTDGEIGRNAKLQKSLSEDSVQTEVNTSIHKKDENAANPIDCLASTDDDFKETKPSQELSNIDNTRKEQEKTSDQHQIEITEQQQSVSQEAMPSENVTYNEDGSAIYTDPKTNYKYKWSAEQNNWVPFENSDSSDSKTLSNPFENEHYKWDAEKNEWIPKTQVTETEHYKWDAAKNEWIPKVKATTSSDIVYDIDEQGQRIYTDKDGTVFFWDADKNAWFPKIDDDFMARYQMNYGFIDNTSESEKEKLLKEEQEAKRKEEEFLRMAEEAKAAAAAAATTTNNPAIGTKRKAAQEPPKWFELAPEHNTKVYVSNLPLDITLDEFAEVMGKCGMIMRDPQTQKHKLKLYAEADGQIKGDGLCDYIKVESVNLALNILDGYILRGNKLHVQRAEFQMRGEYNPALKPKRKKKDKEKLLKMKEKLFDWRPEKMRGERSKNEKIVIIKNLFDPNIFEKEVQLILDYQNDLREECGKCGTVRKVVIYDRHAEGIAQINMSAPEEADMVIQMMHGRFFGKRQLQAEHWDGKTKYKIAESETEVQKRLSNWDEFLENDEHKKSKETAAVQVQKANENVMDGGNVTEEI